MIENVAVGTEIRVTTDKWENAGFGPEMGKIGEVTTSEFTGADELPVEFSDGTVYFVKDGEFEVVEEEELGEPAAFDPGDRVRVVSSPDPTIEVGTEGTVMSPDDDRLFLAILFSGPPPADLNVVDLGGAFIGLKNEELELIEEASATPVVPQPDFAAGTLVRVIDNSAAAVEIGDEGEVLDRDDERVPALAAAFGPSDLVYVVFPGKVDLVGRPLVQVFFPERLEEITVIEEPANGLDSDPRTPIGTHIILTTDIFKPYLTGDRGVIIKHGAYYVVEMYDGVELYLDESEFTVAESQPEADLAEWEKELLQVEPVEAPSLLTRGQYVAFELNTDSWGDPVEIRILSVGDKYLHLEITNGFGDRVAPKLSAEVRRTLGQALIESAEIGE